jgi:3-oxoacyl-[acyl-carrier protein] reductase
VRVTELVFYDVRGRVAVVTGSGRGIGRAIAIRLAREGVRVVVNAKKGLDEVLETVNMIREAGSESSYVLADVSTRDGCRTLVNEAIRRFGRVDILVNNAGVGLYSPFESLTDSLIEKQISVNFKSIVYCSQEAIQYMRDGGVIVNITSIAAFKPTRGLSIYNAMKAAVVQLTRTMAVELADKKIRVFAVAPGLTRTKMGLSYFKVTGLDPEEWARKHTLTGRLVEPEEVAELVVALIKIPSITGEVVVIDGGESLITSE